MGPSKGLFTLKKNTFSNVNLCLREHKQGIDLYVKVYSCFKKNIGF